MPTSSNAPFTPILHFPFTHACVAEHESSTFGGDSPHFYAILQACQLNSARCTLLSQKSPFRPCLWAFMLQRWGFHAPSVFAALPRFIKTWWNTLKRETSGEIKAKNHWPPVPFCSSFSCGLKKLLEKKWNVFKNLTRSSCSQRPNFGQQRPGWMRTYTDIRARGWHQLSLLSPSPSFSHRHSIHIYLFRLWVCVCFWEWSHSLLSPW